MGQEARSVIHGGNTKTRPHHTAHLEDHPGLLQQVGPHVGPDDVVPFVKADLNVLSKSAAVVVASGFSISDGLFRTNKGVHNEEGFLIQDWTFVAPFPVSPVPSYRIPLSSGRL